MKVMYDNRKPDRKLRESDDSLTTRYYNRDGLKPWRGCRSIKFKSNGTQADPDLIYKNYVFNYWDIEDALWNDFLEYNGITEKDAYDGNNIRPGIEEQFDQFVCDMAPSYLDDYIASGAPKNWHSKYEGYRNRRRRIRESYDDDYGTSYLCYDIEYDIQPEDLDMDDDDDDFEKEREEIIASLPTELEVEIDPDYPYDIEDALVEEISAETGWLVDSFNYKRI